MEYLKTGAIFNPDRKYRYELSRVMREGGRRLNSIGLNPSTAGEDKDDPTIKREVAFALAWGYDELYKYNMFAKVTPNPKELCYPETDPVGPSNDKYLKGLKGDILICWGSWGKLGGKYSFGIKNRAYEVKLMFMGRPDCYCLGHNQDGEPKHPLYVLASKKLERW
jgi:hypothetical protein